MYETSVHLDRIRERFPDLEITNVEVNTEGLVNDVVIINREYVFRFPRTDRAREAFVHEAKVLELVHKHTTLPTPVFAHLEDDFAMYRWISGQPLMRNDILKQTKAVQNRIAEQLAIFLKALHTVPVESIKQCGIRASETVRKPEEWLQLYEHVQRELFPLMMAHTKEWVHQHFEPILEDNH
jgi:aminoglycoside 2''-phosphotransferase